jgi:thiosulfate/3-mercaptopyruvate sulfurtransferase
MSDTPRSLPLPGALVSTEWLAAHLAEPDVRVLDGSWHMPQARRDAYPEFVKAHIPGAAFFNIDAIADQSTSLPHMLPSADAFAKAVGILGVGDGDRVVVYDTIGVVSAARVWWTFRVFGHDSVAVLDGGLPRWRAEGRPVASEEAMPEPRRFTAHVRHELVRRFDQLQRNMVSRREQLLDARSRGRFAGTEPEPRAGLRGGHIPGSLNLPYTALHAAGGQTLLAPEALREAFEGAGVDLGRPVVTTCGSGITACVLALGLHLAGHRNVAVYDGSWTEWGGRNDAPVEDGG